MSEQSPSNQLIAITSEFLDRVFSGVAYQHEKDALRNYITYLERELAKVEEAELRAADEPKVLCRTHRFTPPELRNPREGDKCDDCGVDWVDRFKEVPIARAAEPPRDEYLDKYAPEHVREASDFLTEVMCNYADRARVLGSQKDEARASLIGTAVDFLTHWLHQQPTVTKRAESS